MNHTNVTTYDFAALLIRCVGLQLLVAGTILGGVMLISRFTRKQGSNLNDEYYVVSSAPQATVATILCFVIAFILLYGSTTFARWLAKGLQ